MTERTMIVDVGIDEDLFTSREQLLRFCERVESSIDGIVQSSGFGFGIRDFQIELNDKNVTDDEITTLITNVKALIPGNDGESYVSSYEE